MSTHIATAQAYPNIAFIKYWGNRDNDLRLPSNGSISMNLEGLFTRTTVSFQPSLPFDELIINGQEATGKGLERVSRVLDLVREMAKMQHKVEEMSENYFPANPSSRGLLEARYGSRLCDPSPQIAKYVSNRNNTGPG